MKKLKHKKHEHKDCGCQHEQAHNHATCCEQKHEQENCHCNDTSTEHEQKKCCDHAHEDNTCCATVSKSHNAESQPNDDLCDCHNHSKPKSKSETALELIRLLIFTLVYIVATVIHVIFELPLEIALPLFLSLYLMIGYDIIFSAFKNLFKGKLLDENFLMTIATVGAFCIGEYAEAVAVILLYKIGEFFQSYAVSKNRKSISSLMDIASKTATLFNDGVEKTVEPADVEIGDILLVKVGERIPLDGIVVEGVSTLDTSPLTGESNPRDCKLNDNVLSGTINLTGVLKIQVTAKYQDSAVAKILELVENASKSKSKSETFLRKFSKYYTPVVVGLAVLLAVVPSIITGDVSEWVRRALMFLFVSCPCALVISVPMTFFGGIGCASKNGVLVKGGAYLEKLAKANVFVFDKTGTITQGKFSVQQILPEKNRDQILHWAGIAEQHSNHPIAQSIAKLSPTAENDFAIEEIAGHGIVATKDDTTVLCGNVALMERFGVPIENLPTGFGTVVHVAKNSQYLGAIVVSDTLKSSSVEAIKTLNNQGAKTVMLTGDNHETAKHIAQSVGLTQFSAQLLPADKVTEVEKLTGGDNTVAFVGDGINDAPVLMRADIGIAMGAIGSDSAIEASDIVLVDDNLNGIVTSRKIARNTLSIVKQNIIFALSIKLAILALSAFGLINNIVYSILADVGVSVLAILNAMRALRLKKGKK